MPDRPVPSVPFAVSTSVWQTPGVALNTGRTVPKDGNEVLVALGAAYNPLADLTCFSDTAGDGRFDCHPYALIGYRTGLGPSFELGLSASTLGTFSAEPKWQLAGDHESLFALGLGTRGSLALSPLLIALDLPLYLSLHSDDAFAFYLVPRVGLRFAFLQGIIPWPDYGAAVGFRVGESPGFVAEIGVNPPAPLASNNLALEFAMGIVF